MPETWILVRKYIHIFSFRKKTFYYRDPFNFADASIFFAKKSTFIWQNSTFTQSNSVRAVFF